MKYYINEKLFSIHRKFFVKDENNNDVYEISSKVISLGDKTTISDMKGKTVAYIEQKLFHLTPNYDVYIDDEFSFKISKKIQLFKNDYTLSNNYNIKGNFMMLDFAIYDDSNNNIGNISRKFISIGDKYEIEINDIKNEKIVLAIIVAIANDVNRMQKSDNLSD